MRFELTENMTLNVIVIRIFVKFMCVSVSVYTTTIISLDFHFFEIKSKPKQVRNALMLHC